MRNYQTGLEYYFRELGRKIPAGTVITLRPGDAERYMVSHPGLLRPMPMTAQARPQAVRSAPVKESVSEETPQPEAESPAPPLGTPESETKAEAEVEEAVSTPSATEAEQGEQPQAEEKGEAKPKGKARAKKS